MPDCLNQPIVAVARGPRATLGGEVTVLVMEDVGRWMVPAGDYPIPLEQHLAFMAHMAALHATFWNAGPEIDLIPASNRLMELSPWLVTTEAELGSDAIIPPLVGRGWAAFAELAPQSRVRGGAGLRPQPAGGRAGADALHARARQLEARQPRHRRPRPDRRHRLGVARVGAPPARTWPGTSPSTRLDSPRARRPRPRRTATASRRLGVDTEPWWDDQLRLSLLGGLVQFGWEKALGGPGPELDWWLARAGEGARLLAS